MNAPSHLAPHGPFRTGFFAAAMAAVLSIAATASLHAATHYIRAGASGLGDGSTWANAYPTFASVTWTRGDTYYVAGGTYNEDVLISKAVSGALWITVKKANTTDNQSDAGWDATYASQPAVVNGKVSLDKGYVEIDGVTGSGTTGHGIQIHCSQVPTSGQIVVLDLGASTAPYKIHHCEVRGAGFAASQYVIVGISHNCSATPQKNTLIEYCWIHETTTNGVQLLGLAGTSYTDYGLLFQNNVISETGGCTDVNNHGQGMQLGQGSEIGYCIIRNNVFRNILGSGMIVFLSSANNANHHDIQIYNNVFYITDLNTYNTLSPGPIWAKADSGFTNVHFDNAVIANNTFYGLGDSTHTSVSGIVLIESSHSNVTMTNNLWENCRLTSLQGSGVNTVTRSGYYNNLSTPTSTSKQVNGSASTFVNPASADFHLVSGGYAIGKAINLPTLLPSMTTDIEGTPRGGVWDLGAYQYQTTANSAPLNVNVNITTGP